MLGNRISGPSLKAFTSFIKGMDFHKDSSSTFFDENLLHLLDNNFGYRDAAIIVRDKDKYVTGIGNERTNVILNEFATGFYKRDVLSKYINQNRIKLLRASIPIVRITDLIQDDYENSDYAHFLDQVDLKYAVAFVYASHTLCLYKDDLEGDFSDEEVDLLSSVYSVIGHMYQRFLLVQNQNLTMNIRNKIFEDFKVGYFIFDETGNSLEHNGYAVQYALDIFGKQSLNAIFAGVRELFKNTTSFVQQHNDYTIGMERLLNVDPFGQVKTYYYIVMTKMALDMLPTRFFNGFSELSTREREVLEAFCNGANYSEIAKNLYISENTVRSHLKSIYRKLDVSNQRSLLRLYFQYESFANASE